MIFCSKKDLHKEFSAFPISHDDKIIFSELIKNLKKNVLKEKKHECKRERERDGDEISPLFFQQFS